MGKKNKYNFKILTSNFPCAPAQCEDSYLLTHCRPAHGGPLSGRHPHVMAAFGQSKRLVYSITRNGSVQVVAKETAGGGSNLLHRGVTVPPVFIAVVSNRRTGP